MEKKILMLLFIIFVGSMLTGCKKNDKPTGDKISETTEYNIYAYSTERTEDTSSGQYMIIMSSVGDEFSVSINNKKTNTLSYDETDGVISIINEDGKILQSGCLLNTRWYKEYYDTVTNECNIICNGSSANVDYIFYSYTINENDNDKVMYEFLGWIIGSNTGIVWEGGSDESDALDLFSDLWFTVETTDQTDNNFIIDPDSIELDNNDIEFSVDENGNILYEMSE